MHSLARAPTRFPRTFTHYLEVISVRRTSHADHIDHERDVDPVSARRRYGELCCVDRTSNSAEACRSRRQRDRCTHGCVSWRRRQIVIECSHVRRGHRCLVALESTRRRDLSAVDRTGSVFIAYDYDSVCGRISDSGRLHAWSHGDAPQATAVLPHVSADSAAAVKAAVDGPMFKC